jgi:glucose/arabinose dehydrogenase
MKFVPPVLALKSVFFAVLLVSIFNQYVSAYTLDHFTSNKPVLIDPDLDAELVAKGFKFPTSMVFLDENDILVLEKNDGTVRRILNGTVLDKPLLDVYVDNQVERGMLGIVVSKNSSDHKTYVFLYYTEAGKEGEEREGTIGDGDKPIANRVYKYEFINNKLDNPKLILSLPAEPGSYHNGGIVTLGPDSSIYLVIGDVAYYDYFESYPHPLDGRGGILRIPIDENIINNNDSLNSVKSEIYYAYGIRNSFGIDFDPVTGKLWDTENGPGFGDEINLVNQGFNSGWSVIQGIWKVESYFEGKIALVNPDEVLFDFGNYSTPEFIWKETIAPTAIKFINSQTYGKQYENDIVVGDFNQGNLYHFELNEDRTEISLDGQLVDKIANRAEELEQVIFGKGFGGVTDIEIGPDGYLYILTTNKGGHNCNESNKDTCIEYSSGEEGAVYRIIPKKDT